MGIKADIKDLERFFKKDQMVYAGYWLAFILFILVFIFDEYQREFIRAILFLAGFLYGKHFSERRAKNYIENYKLPGMPYEPGKFLDYKLHKKAFPKLPKLIILTLIGIVISSWGMETDFNWFIYSGPFITGMGIGEIVTHVRMKKYVKESFLKFSQPDDQS